MTNKKNFQTERIGLLHQPLGKEHPYNHEPYERSPRQPQVGDQISLGAVTCPPGTVERVWAVWTIEGEQDEAKSEGRRTDTTEDGDNWSVELPTSDRRQLFTYRIYASSGDQILHTDDFTFFTAAWFSVGKVIEAWRNESSLFVECELQGSDKKAAYMLTLPEPDLLKIETVISLETAKHDQSSYQKVGDQEIIFSHNNMELRIQRSPMQVSVLRSGVPLLTEITPMEILLGKDDHVRKLRQSYTSPPDEAFYGFGERYNSLDQRGETLDVRVFDQNTKQGKRTYYPVPFMLSSRGYALYLDTARNVAYDAAASHEDRWSYCAELGPDGKFESYLITDPDPLQQIARFADLTGKHEVPPRWVFGPWMSSNEWNSQEEVLRHARLTKEHKIPSSVMVIEAWSDEATFYIWNDAQYTPRPGDESFTYDDFTFPTDGLWPDPKGMIESLHADGLRVVLWQIPVHKTLDFPHTQHDLDWESMIVEGYAALESTGEPYLVRPFWFHGGLVLDVTNPEAVDWWLSKRAYLLDELGVDGFKTDGGEHLWGHDLRFFRGRGDEIINRYPMLYIKAYHEFAREHRGGDTITFSRAGFTGAGAFPAHWAGDEASTWEAFRATIIAGQNVGMAGTPFWGWDIAGFSGDIPTAELYLRATAMAVFCPIMQYHSDFNHHRKPNHDRTPWNIQERTGNINVIPIFRAFANLRMNLLPMIFDQAKRSAETGIPMMRALPLLYPEDQRVRDYPYQYLFGEDLLVVPVVEEGVERWSAYLPEGKWFDLWSGVSHEGPCVVEAEAPIDRIPVFVRSGAILPLDLGSELQLQEAVGNDVDNYRHLSFLIHAGTDASFDWYDSLTEKMYRFNVEQIGETISVTTPMIPHDITLLIRMCCPERVILDGVNLKEVPEFDAQFEPVWQYSREEKLAIVRLPASKSIHRVILHGDN
jgi:alpha-glucosidase (family GH31 glycosyl hydrolase)